MVDRGLQTYASLVEQVSPLNILHGPLLGNVVVNEVADAISHNPGVLLVLLVAHPELAILRTDMEVTNGMKDASRLYG